LSTDARTLYRPLSSTVKEYVTWATSDHPRVGTGLPILDSRTNGGAAAGEVILFQARSQVGKTAVAGNVICHNKGLPTVMFSLEMHGRYIAKRLAAIYNQVGTGDLERELQTTGRSAALAKLVEDFPYLAIVDKPALSIRDMGAALDVIEDVWGQKVGLIVVDYLELIGGTPSLNAVEKVDGVARKFKDFTRERDAASLLLHQVGRGEGGAGAEPLSLESGRYGGETQADYVLGAYRPCLRKGITQAEYMDERWHIYFQFLKTRGGDEIHPAGELYEFNPFTLRIQPWRYRQADLGLTPEPAQDEEPF